MQGNSPCSFSNPIKTHLKPLLPHDTQLEIYVSSHAARNAKSGSNSSSYRHDELNYQLLSVLFRFCTHYVICWQVGNFRIVFPCFRSSVDCRLSPRFTGICNRRSSESRTSSSLECYAEISCKREQSQACLAMPSAADIQRS